MVSQPVFCLLSFSNIQQNDVQSWLFMFQSHVFISDQHPCHDLQRHCKFFRQIILFVFVDPKLRVIFCTRVLAFVKQGVRFLTPGLGSFFLGVGGAFFFIFRAAAVSIVCIPRTVFLNLSCWQGLGIFVLSRHERRLQQCFYNASFFLDETAVVIFWALFFFNGLYSVFHSCRVFFPIQVSDSELLSLFCPSFCNSATLD